VFKSDFVNNEAVYIAHTIQEMVDRKERTFGDVTVLFRNNAMSADIESAFNQNGIPYQLLSGRGFYEREEVKDVIKYLEFIDNPRSLDAFDRIIRKPKRFIAEKTIEKIQNQIDQGNILDVLKHPDEIARMQKKAKVDAQEFVEVIEKLQAKKDEVSAREIIEELLIEIDYENKVLGVHDEATRIDKKQNIDKIIERIAAMEDAKGRMVTIGEFVESVTLFNDDAEDLNAERVKLMTIHGSKGLEFPVVFLIGLNEGTFPSFYIQEPEDFEEERRLCYVAITRAKEKLYITHSRKKYQKDGSKKEIYPSMFLYEIRDDLKEIIE
jgi:DNA helicase-2/ATP-dependent DNA helicase PcrA